MEETIESAAQDGFVTTLLGRRRDLRDIRSSNHTARQQAERMARNTPIQGSAADLIKLAMIAVHRWLEQEKLQTRLILQVHDELVLDVQDDELKAVTMLVRKVMEEAYKLDIPLLTEARSGVNWGSMQVISS